MQGLTTAAGIWAVGGIRLYLLVVLLLMLEWVLRIDERMARRRRRMREIEQIGM